MKIVKYFCTYTPSLRVSLDSPFGAMLFKRPSTTEMERNISTINPLPMTFDCPTLTFLFHFYFQLTLLSPLFQDILRFLDNSEVKIFPAAKDEETLFDNNPKNNRALPIRHNDHVMRSRHNDVTISDKDLFTSLICNTKPATKIFHWFIFPYLNDITVSIHILSGIYLCLVCLIFYTPLPY